MAECSPSTSLTRQQGSSEAELGSLRTRAFAGSVSETASGSVSKGFLESGGKKVNE